MDGAAIFPMTFLAEATEGCSMAPIKLNCLIGLLICLAAIGIAEASEKTALPERLPNIVFILVDDLGWTELGCYGNTFNETPHLDGLALRSVRFTQAYAAAPVCSPFRASLMSGQYPARVGITDYLRSSDTKHLSTDHFTLAELMKKAGYKTGMIGKWHLTGYANHGAKEVPPSAHGFDETLVSENRGIGGGSYFHPYHFNREIDKRLSISRQDPRAYLTDRLNTEAVEFIERHHDKPFFLYKSHYAVHTRLAGKPELVAKYEQKAYAGKDARAKKNNPHLAAQLEVFDQGVGMIVEKLKELGIAENTIVIFMSDNGGDSRVTSNAPLRAGKSTLYEEGIREPLIVHWPGQTKAGSVCSEPVRSVDFYPTLAEIAGAKVPRSQPLDGVSLVQLLKNPASQLSRDALYWHYPLTKPHFLGGFSSGAIRQGDWKLVEHFGSGKLELFNLKRDLSEREDLAEKMLQNTKQLHDKLQQWRSSVGAKVLKHAAQG